jgi:CheY-like chemotaxis protein
MDTQSQAAPVVLVVEDEFLVRDYAADILEEAGFQTLLASDADEALLLLAGRSDIRVLFTDINLNSRTDGIELAREVAARWPDVGVLVTSGHARPGAGAMPADSAFISKPYPPRSVVALVQQLAGVPVQA